MFSGLLISKENKLKLTNRIDEIQYDFNRRDRNLKQKFHQIEQ